MRPRGELCQIERVCVTVASSTGKIERRVPLVAPWGRASTRIINIESDRAKLLIGSRCEWIDDPIKCRISERLCRPAIGVSAIVELGQRHRRQPIIDIKCHLLTPACAAAIKKLDAEGVFTIT